MEILFATGNPAKVKSISKKINDEAIKITSLNDLGLELDVEEKQRLYEEATNEFMEVQSRRNDELKMYEAKENYSKANKAPEVEIDME